ncbi:restriction endonuclease subunit S [Ralstonia mannitolilytica]|uniref:restriction endonuclease subunit S n=1 Tax=Ralstonia mannitolilytica TaxID=105219 RepID=UPI000787C829|nr:restriction endonuclease subunit S [Ralstonia mannitolilytica]
MKEDNLLSLSYGRIIRKDIEASDGLLPESFETYQIVQVGDIVLRLTDLQNDKRSLRSALVEERGIITSAYLALEPYGIRSAYLAYLLRAYDQTKVFYSMGGGLRQSMKFADLKRLSVVLPTDEEQLSIAAFLDRETAKIDALIAEQERLIALLAEKRLATISHAVTRGLTPDVPMKDSGVAWLGEVPAHWEIKPLRYCVDYQEGPGVLANDFHDEGVPLLRVAGVQDHWARLTGCNYLDPKKVAKRWERFRLQRGDLLISASASMGTVCEVGDEAVGAIAYTGIIRLRGKTGQMVKSFIRHLVVSSQFLTQIDQLKAGATIQHFGPTHLSQMFVVRPPEEEQRAIAAFVDDELERLGILRSAAERAMALLSERRSALIAAAVTGQIDVRGVMAQQTNNEEAAAA